MQRDPSRRVTRSGIRSRSRNAGAAVAHHVIVTDRLPPGVEPINLLPKMDGGSCSAVGSTEGRAAFTIICVRAMLDAGASATVTIDIRIDTDRSCGTDAQPRRRFGEGRTGISPGERLRVARGCRRV
jgi:hypothetical protein